MEKQAINKQGREALRQLKQGTDAWKIARLGYITASRVSPLMTTPRSKAEQFSETAKTYLYEVGAERELMAEYAGGVMTDMYFERVDASSASMRWGTENEDTARMTFTQVTGLDVQEVGLIVSEDADGFADSPDGIITTSDGKVFALEIKCPSPATFMRYRTEIKTAEDLKRVKPEYYWQSLGHILANRADGCFFAFYDPMLIDGFRYIYIETAMVHEDVFALLDRIRLANEFINAL